MKRIGRTRATALLGLALSLGVALVASSPAPAATAANASGCVVKHTLSNPFRAWGDTTNYALAPGGDFESGAAGWTLTGGAAVVAGNASFLVGGATHRSALRVPAGGTATNPSMCIDSTFPLYRVFARNLGNPTAKLSAEVLYLDAKGKIKGKASGVVASTPAWAPSAKLNIKVKFDAAVAAGAAPVQFRFTSTGAGGDWRVDDVYIDPFMRR